MELPNLRSLECSPRLDGIGVAINMQSEGDGQTSSVIHGIFRVPAEEFSHVQGAAHNLLVMVVTKGDQYVVKRPFADFVIFEEDEERSSVARGGHFNLDVMEEAGLDRAGKDTYVLFSLGQYLSNILTIEGR